MVVAQPCHSPQAAARHAGPWVLGGLRLKHLAQLPRLPLRASLLGAWAMKYQFISSGRVFRVLPARYRPHHHVR